MMKILGRLLLLAGLFAAAPAFAQVPPAPAAARPATPPPAQDVALGYVLGADDVIEVSVLGQPEFTTRARVKANGAIQLPFIGETNVSGLTSITAGAAIGEKLRAGAYYAKPVVNVEIVSFASRYVVVLGEVAQPGLQPVDRTYRVSEVIARAGGMRETGADFVILRRQNGEELKLPFEKLAAGSASDDPEVTPGDKVYVPAADLFYIYGQVNAPGVYPIKGGEMTVRKALARGGGLNATGSAKRVKIFRDGEELKTDLAQTIRAGDVIVVGERLF